jgi:hypothetical protein
MKCVECRDELAAYLEGLLDETHRSQIEAHVSGCSACRTELQEVRELTARLGREGVATPPVSLETRVMDRIVREQAVQIRRLKMKKRIRMLGISGALAAAVAIVIVASFWFTQSAEAQKAAEVMTRGAKAVPNLSTVHIVGKMRTAPRDNFSYINAKADFVPVEVWKQSMVGSKFPKWRVEKPGRMVVMDGKSTTMLIRPDLATKVPCATWGAFDTGWVLGLSSVQDMIASELRSARMLRWDLKLTQETTGAGEQKRLVTVEAKTWLPANDVAKNAFFDLSDMRRVYRFDAKTDKLEGMEAYLHQPDGDVLVWTIDRIEYGQPIDPSVFTLELPKTVRWTTEPKPVSDNEKYEKMTPEQAARALFEACAKKDWAEVEKFWNAPVGEDFKKYFGGLRLIRLGTPFQSAISILNGDWFVPYEIKLSDGTVTKWNLALRPNKAAKRYIVDGGI